jgi:peptidoglycan hydrolase-like protein with peptidoglycan-binding domain
MSISDSVGDGGTNRVDDVLRVQSLLNQFRINNGRKPIEVDGKVGPETIGAIRDFQQTVTHEVDGRVDTDGPAIKKLEELIEAKVFEAAVLGMIGVIADYDPRTASIHSDNTISSIVETLAEDEGVA